MKIAIFADIHGKILLPFKMVDYYQKLTGEKIDMILQCGDVGIYPYLERLDKATLKHAMDDRDELGFNDQFVSVDPDIQKYLDALDIHMVCVRGNHEDHEYLDDLEKLYPKDAIFPVDCYQRVWMFKSGYIETFEFHGETLDVVGVGRIGDHKDRSDKRFIQAYEKRQINKLIHTIGKADILITHDKNGDSKRGYGLPEIANILDNILIPYHFHGHTGETYAVSLDDNGITNTIKINELEFRRDVLPPNSMIVLNKEGDTITFEPIGYEITNMFLKNSWKSTRF